MGLDQYLYKTKLKLTDKELNELGKEYNNEKSNIPEEKLDRIFNLCIEIGYWRKDWELQDYVNDIANEKDIGEFESFNCVHVELTKEEIKSIKKAFKNCEDTKEIMDKALEEIKNGYKIFYYSWW